MDTIFDTLRSLMKNVHIAMVLEGKYCEISTRVLKNGKVVSKETRKFELNGDALTEEAIVYLNRYEKNHAYCFLSTLLDTINQGAVSQCSEERLVHLDIDPKSTTRLCLNDSWTVYSNIYDLEEVQERFEAVGGVDYIFPMASVVDFLRRKDPREGTVMYLLNNQYSAAMGIFRGDDLLYGAHFIFNETEEELEIEEGEDATDKMIEEGLDDEMEEVVELDNINELDDLDQLEDLDNFSMDGEGAAFDDVEGFEGEEMDLETPVGNEEQDGLSLRKDLLLFEFMKNSLEEFYKNDRYEGEFVEECVIYDTYGGSGGLQKYLFEDLGINAAMMKVDLPEVVCDLSVREAEQ